MQEYVCGFMIGDVCGEQRIALIRKQKPAWQKGMLNGIGGKIEPGEKPEDAMVREFEEEAGVRCETWQLGVVITGQDWRVYFFITRGDLMELWSKEAEKIEEWPLSPFPKGTIPNLRWIVPLCMDGDISKPVCLDDMSNPMANGATMRAKAAKEGAA